MKIISYRYGTSESFGVLRAGGDVVDVPAAFRETGGRIPSSLREFLDETDDPLASLTHLPLHGDRLNNAVRPLGALASLAPVPRPSKIVAVGLNYADHCREQGVERPKVPVLFAKYPTSLIGDGAEIVWEEALTRKVDYEAELGVIIGKRARRVQASAAVQHIFGYTIVNDVSARDLQFGDGQWVRGKSLDSFCPMGPWIVTADEIPDPHSLGIRCRVNRTLLQDSKTSEMIFRIPELIEFVTWGITLEPGDVIATGTPAGVGVFRKPPRYLADGDEVVVEIDGIGALRNRCRVMRSE